MSRPAPEATLRCLLAALLLASGPALSVQENGASPGPGPLVQEAEKTVLEAIRLIEARDGAYSADLPEQMLSLGLAMQQQDRHGEAVNAFKRGVHLARINNGLYCPEQVPLLQGEISSSIALGDYARVDELQEYLYRVQLRSLSSSEYRAAALLQQATWQFNAYQLGLGSLGAERLVTMWDMYRLAWQDIGSTEGETSLKLLPPLYGLLRTQYLISEYRADHDPAASSFGSAHASANAGRLHVYRSENYELGKSVILAIHKIQQSNRGEGSREAIEALVALGDWALWHDKRDDAAETYRLAVAELAGRDDAQEVEDRLFGEPVPLPDLKGLRPLPAHVGAEEGNILLEFGVDTRGKVVNLERLDTNSDIDSKADRLMRALRYTKFRPRYEAGLPAGTDKLVRAYEIKP